MHYHLEVVIPPTDDVLKSIKEVMCEYDENDDDSHYSFWDWYVVGGRFSGQKLESSLDQDKLKVFYDDAKQHKITVSSMQCGKQTISPPNQIPVVDELWKKHFPDCSFKKPPMFSHSSDQYSDLGDIPGDIMTLGQVLKSVPKLTVHHVMFAQPLYSDPNKLSCGFQMVTEFYTGTNFIDSSWDALFSSAVEARKKDFDRCSKEYKAEALPQSDWLVVTVDYHS